MTTIYFVRHGESEANAGAWLAGHSDVCLTSRGLAQAKESAEQLGMVAFDAVLSSDLVRAMQTAQAHAMRHDVPILPSTELREFDAGALTGMRYADIAVQYPHLFPDAWRDAFGVFCPPQGESLPDAAARLHAFVLRAARQWPNGTLLFVTHAGVLRAFWGHITGVAPENLTKALPFCPNGAYAKLTVEDGRIAPAEYGVTTAPEGLSDAASRERLW